MLELQLRGPLIGYAQSTVHSLWATRPAYSASTYLGCLVGGIQVYIKGYSPVKLKNRDQGIQFILCCVLYHYSIQVIPTRSTFYCPFCRCNKEAKPKKRDKLFCIGGLRKHVRVQHLQYMRPNEGFTCTYNAA